MTIWELLELERDQVAGVSGRGAVVGGYVDVFPIAGETVGADDYELFVVRRVEVNGFFACGDGERGCAGGTAGGRYQFSLEEEDGTRVGLCGGGALGGGYVVGILVVVV